MGKTVDILLLWAIRSLNRGNLWNPCFQQRTPYSKCLVFLMSLVANRFGRIIYSFLVFKVRLPEENNNKYLRFQIDELPKTLGKKVTKTGYFILCCRYIFIIQFIRNITKYVQRILYRSYFLNACDVKGPSIYYVSKRTDWVIEGRNFEVFRKLRS